ncbi:hypothetical protein [Bryobacter aggregatus]|uniref:hypothetical protein n=1 Tax=Bryobacter aggregatus TaxID=360054 RepID=UPI0004E20622|nr:hypothetical protein [Bryobacter aggregatus]
MVTLMSHTDYRYLNAQWVARGIFGNASLIVYSVQLLLCLMTTMSLVPSLLDPARNAWIVSHPLSRASILLGRFLGCMVLAAGSFVLYVPGSLAK